MADDDDFAMEGLKSLRRAAAGAPANPVDVPRKSGCSNRLGCATVIVPNAW